MRLPPLHEARFVRRLNRFAATVSLNGREVMVHVANSGRLRELLQPGSLCYLTDQPGSHRKTRYDLSLVAIDRPPRRWRAGACGGLRYRARSGARHPSSYPPTPACRTRWCGKHGATARYPTSRATPRPAARSATTTAVWTCFWSRRRDKCFVEVKSVTLVQDGVARFPDAPTDRGRRHVATLVRAVEDGYRAAAVFVVQRPDAVGLSPYDAHDPLFGAALREAVAAGVEAYAFTCAVTRESITIAGEVPVLL